MYKWIQVLLLVVLTLSMAGCRCCNRSHPDPTFTPKTDTSPNRPSDSDTPIPPDTGDPNHRSQTHDPVEQTDVKTVYFSYDRFDIRPDQIPDLEKSAKFIKKQSRTILIEGHCDERGTIEYNMSLGQKRAEAVKAFLVSRGVEEAKISTISRGKEAPAVPGDSEAAHAKNRRCEFYYNSK